jgi:ABC-type cobalamin/Fe3+-siderophores transport system ATPase subunit
MARLLASDPNGTGAASVLTYGLSVNISGPEGQQAIAIATGKVTIVAGPNGVGKSSFLDEIYRHFHSYNQAEMLSGHRQISFQTDDVDQLSGISIDNLFEQFKRSPQSASRYRNNWGDQHLKSVVRRVINHHVQSNEEIIKALETGGSLESARTKHPRLLTTLNQIFDHAGMAVNIELFEGALRVVRGDSRYEITKLSDGERAALLLVGAILIRPADTIIIVDEPERHLNPSISGPLIAAAVRARADVAFVFATHDLPLIEWIKPQEIIYIQNSKVISNVNGIETRQYDLEMLNASDELDDRLKYALLGSRKALLLVEGELTSDDKALYRLIYPGWNVVARGGWEAVSTGVRALRSTDQYNWITAAGVIDGDGRSETEKAALASDHIFSLACPTIENVFVIREAVHAVATTMFIAKGGQSPEVRLASAESLIRGTIAEERDKIIARQTVWRVNRAISASKPSVKTIIAGQQEIPSIDIIAIKLEVEAETDATIAAASPWELLQKVPFKKSRLQKVLCDSIGVENFAEYKSVLLWQMQSQTEAGVLALEAISSAAPSLPAIPD